MAARRRFGARELNQEWAGWGRGGGLAHVSPIDSALRLETGARSLGNPGEVRMYRIVVFLPAVESLRFGDRAGERITDSVLCEASINPTGKTAPY